MDNKKGKLFVISGPSGSGKGELCKKVLETKLAEVSISATTRAPRNNEVDGVNYFYITKEEFEKRIGNGEFLEYAQYNGNFYGTPKDYVVKCLEKGINIILEIDVQGGLRVKNMIPEAVLIMVSAPDYNTLVARLAGRGDTSEDDMAERLERSHWEYSQLPLYNYLVINETGKLEKAVATVCEIISGEAHEECKTQNHRDFAESFYKA
ncbi:MAG: guanylate kinase [Ruminococcaceae bacterium]|nr:guanylate kinase [Oscillospiraceae bacterium]